MADWVYVLIDCLLFVGVMTVGFLIGHLHGHHRGWHQASSYYKGYRHEDGEIINRLRGRIIWLEASIRDTEEMLKQSEDMVVNARGRLEKTKGD